MSFLSRVLTATAALFLVPLVACTVDGASEEKEDVSAESESALVTAFRSYGELPGTGETRTVHHSGAPRYGSFTFYANPGEEIDAWVRGLNGADAVAWILDKKGHSIAFNDDASEGGTLASHLKVTVPAALGQKAQLRLVFREYRLRPAKFAASVRVKSGMFACTTDTDCMKVSAGGCCTGWQNIAVNASRADDHAAQNQCKPPYPPCAPPPFDAENGSTAVARCEANVCVLAELCNAANEPNRKYVGTSPQMCMLVRFACEAGTTMFSSDCGCGCEQPADCPSFINCMPGPGVSSCGAERTRCPLTPVAY